MSVDTNLVPKSKPTTYSHNDRTFEKGIENMDSIQLKPSIQQFLVAALASSEFQILPLAGDASNRRYFRIVFGETTYVLMVWEPFDNVNSYPFLSVLDLFHRHEVNVPKVINLSPELGVILLEDLGDLTLERKFWESQDQLTVVPFYQMALDELIKIHYKTSTDKALGCTAFQISFDTEKLLWEMNYAKKHLLQQAAKIKLSNETEKKLDNIFLDICQKLDNQPKTICHRDYHSRNLMIKLGKMRVIDFQDARLGPIEYDLVSLFRDSYVDLNKDVQDSLKKYYIENANSLRKSPISPDEFHQTYHLQMIQRCFKACGSFSSFLNIRNDKRYLSYIAPTLNRVQEALSMFPEYRFFAEFLSENGLMDLEYDKL